MYVVFVVYVDVDEEGLLDCGVGVVCEEFV